MLAGVAARPLVYIMTRNRALAKAFYVDALGLTAVSDGPAKLELDSAGTPVLITEAADCTASVHPVMGWRVPSIVDAVQSLRGKGVVFELYDGMGQDEHGVWTSPSGDVRLAFFKDPDGNLLTISQ